MRRFPKKKNTYGLKEIDGALKHAKLERHHDDILRLNFLKVIPSFLLPNNGRNVEVRYVDLRNHIEAPAIGVAPAIEPLAVGTPAIGSSSSTTEIGAVVVKVCSQLEEYGKILQKLEVHGKMLHSHGKMLEQIAMFTVRDITIPFGDTLLLGQYQFSTLEKYAKRKREEEGKGERQKKTNANKKNKKAEEVDVPLKKKVEGTKIEDLTDGQLDHVPLIQLKTLIPKKSLANRAPRKRWAKFPELDEFQSTVENLLQQVAPGEGLEVVKDLMVDDDVEVNLEAISSEYGDLLEWKNGYEKIDDVEKDGEDSEQQTVVASADQATAISVEEQTIEVTKSEDEASQVTYHFFAGADQATAISIEEQTIEVAKTEDEASQTKESKKEAEQSKEEVVKGKDDDDENLQKKTRLCDEKNWVDQVWSLRKDKLSPEAMKDNRSTYKRIDEEIVCLNALYTLHPKEWLDNEVIDVYIKALIQYFDTQHRAREAKEKIVLKDVFSYQYIGRAFNVRRICIYDSLVDAKIVNVQKKKKLSPGHQRIEDQLSKILPKMLIWTDFADRSSPPIGSEIKNYGLNSKWTTRFGKCPIQPNGYGYGVYMLVFIDNILRWMKFLDLIDGDECHYTIVYDILRLGVEP
ncbi:hypothetical protein GIB67_013091 [Kingdonia uniflora]|uniref:Uncharacterized protein n=1 Tax=Kingdonia uniflora TaxID=39325 RepID=A0A7J7LXL3_9MAGN|nr:hypothetical protein GIB67_013091 [Kingdonia uniflora]